MAMHEMLVGAAHSLHRAVELHSTMSLHGPSSEQEQANTPISETLWVVAVWEVVTHPCNMWLQM